MQKAETMVTYQVVKKVLEAVEELNSVVSLAGGSVFGSEELSRISALELFSILIPNNVKIQFKYHGAPYVATEAKDDTINKFERINKLLRTGFGGTAQSKSAEHPRPDKSCPCTTKYAQDDHTKF